MRFTINFLPVFLIFLLAAPLSLSAAALSATSPDIAVLDLPEPQISKIDSNGIVHMTVPVDPDARADFRADVIVSDSNGSVLETSPQVVVDNPGDVKVPVRTSLKAGYIITPEISNNNYKSTGAEGVHSEAPAGEPSAPPGGGSTTSPSTKWKTETKYVVTEVAGEQVVIEKIVEVDKPAPEKVILSNSDISTSEAVPQDTGNNHESPAPTSQPDPVDQVTPLPDILETVIKDGMLTAKGEMILVSFLIALIIVTLILIFKMLRDYFKKRPQSEKENIDNKLPKIKRSPANFFKNIYAVLLALAIVFNSRIRKKDKAPADKISVKSQTKKAKRRSSSKAAPRASSVPLNELTILFNTWGATYDLNPSLVPLEAAETFQRYQRAYETYKALQSANTASESI